jgi:ABC-2 type transport system permease protein
MTAEPRTAALRIRSAPGVPARLVGLGSVFGKTVRDGRVAALLLGLAGGLMMLAGGAALISEWPDAASRRALVASLDLLPPVVHALLGDPVGLDRLGGFLSWRFASVAPVLLGIWSVVALSGTIAGEVGKGSLDLLVSTPLSRRSIAGQKALGHVALVAVVLLIAAAMTTVTGLVFASVPGDEISMPAALGAWLLIGLLALAPGAIAFIAAPVLGRMRGAAIGAAFLFGGFLIDAYSGLAPGLRSLEPLSWFAWTGGHRPLAGIWDWPPVIALAGVTIVLFVAGIVVFERRDVGATVGAGRSILPGLPSGASGPFARQFTDRIGDAVGWGIGIGVYGAFIASSADEFVVLLDQMPGIDEMMKRFYPGIDLSEPSALLELAFVSFGSLIIGLAAAGFVAGVASDETGRRLDLVLSTPLARARWLVANGLAALAAVSVTLLVAGTVIAVGVAGAGGDLVAPFAGSAVLALYGGAFAGIGMAVVGLGRSRHAALVTAVVSVASYLLGSLGPALGLPDWAIALSLSEHLGRPMSGIFDPVGLAVMAVLAFGGVLLGAWGIARRDLLS